MCSCLLHVYRTPVVCWRGGHSGDEQGQQGGGKESRGEEHASPSVSHCRRRGWSAPGQSPYADGTRALSCLQSRGQVQDHLVSDSAALLRRQEGEPEPILLPAQQPPQPPQIATSCPRSDSAAALATPPPRLTPHACRRLSRPFPGPFLPALSSRPPFLPALRVLPFARGCVSGGRCASRSTEQCVSTAFRASRDRRQRCCAPLPTTFEEEGKKGRRIVIIREEGGAHATV